jgi:hypothetical protein
VSVVPQYTLPTNGNSSINLSAVSEEFATHSSGKENCPLNKTRPEIHSS